MKWLVIPVILWLMLCCAPQNTVMIRSTTDVPSITAASIVTIVSPIIIDDESGIPSRIGFEPTCNAFCVQRMGTNYLITAAHCVDGLEHGSEFRYLKPNGWGSGTAKLIWFDPDFDRAVASVDDSDLVPLTLDTDYEPESWDLVSSASSYFDARSDGHVIGMLTHGKYDTTQTIIKGWSGSPVINSQGKVWGIVSMCRFDWSVLDCFPDYAIVTKVP